MVEQLVFEMKRRYLLIAGEEVCVSVCKCCKQIEGEWGGFLTECEWKMWMLNKWCGWNAVMKSANFIRNQTKLTDVLFHKQKIGVHKPRIKEMRSVWSEKC